MNDITQANHYFQQGNYQQAEQLFRQLLTNNPKDVNALWGLGKVALVFERYKAAYDLFQQCLALLNKEPRLWLSLATACQKLRRFDEAEKALLNAFQRNENYLPSLLALSVYYCEAGEYQQAEHYLTLILAISPHNIQAFGLLVRINQVILSGELAQIMWKRLNAETELSTQDKISLHYAFFTLFENDKQYDKAFEQLENANALQYKTTHFTVDDMQPFFNALTENFNEEFFNKLGDCNHLSSMSSLITSPKSLADIERQVIFIVGQPRSGSTLLEQMLVGHQAINTAGELPFFAGDIAQGIFQMTGQHFPEGCKLLTDKNADDLAQRYLKSIQSIVPDSQYIIDKMPANYQSIGLIKLLLPKAKIIHITRDSIDISWSIYRNNFAVAEPYFCSLSEIEKYHQCYERVMNHWQKLCPEFIHTLDYADLVAQPEKAISEVLAFCDLEFEEQCIDFSQQKRHISTLSDLQLREGIKKQQTNAWLPYKDYLPEGFIARFNAKSHSNYNPSVNM